MLVSKTNLCTRFNNDPRGFNNDHPSEAVLVHEMMVIEPGENPTRVLTWKPQSHYASITR